MSHYLFLLHDDAANPVPPNPELFDRFVAWTRDLHAAGQLVSVERLGNEGGKTLTKRGGSFVIDGPFAEGKEAVLGLYVISAASEEEAIEIAKGCPMFSVGGTLELRLILDFPKP